VSLNLKKSFVAAMAGFALAVPAIFVGGTAASAEDLPAADTTSQGVIAPAADTAAAPSAADATTDNAVVQESAPAPAKPIVAGPAQPEAATVVAPPASVPPAPENTQPSPPQEEVVVVGDKVAPPAPQTTGPVTDVKCVTLDKKSMSHTFNEATGATDITVSGKPGTPACKPAFVIISAFVMTKPNSVWPQEKVGEARIYVDKVGSFSGKPPYIKDCRQYDVGISFVSWEKATPSAVLTEPGKPYEPEFLHQYSNGPTTYHTSSAAGCAGKPEAPEPKTTTSAWIEGKFVCGDTLVNLTRTITTTYYKVVFVDGKFQIVEDTAKNTVVTENSTRPLKDTEIESCKPVVPNPEVVTSEWVSGAPDCVTDKVTQTRTVTTTTTTPVLVSGSTWTKHVETTTKTETQQIALDDTQLKACHPVIVPVGNHPGTPPAAHAVTPKPPVLASTGAEIGGTVALAALLFGLGGAFVVSEFRRRRKATNE